MIWDKVTDNRRDNSEKWPSSLNQKDVKILISSCLFLFGSKQASMEAGKQEGQKANWIIHGKLQLIPFSNPNLSPIFSFQASKQAREEKKKESYVEHSCQISTKSVQK